METKGTEEVYKEIQALRERREAVLHENYDSAEGEQRLVELRNLFESQQSVLECLRSRVLSQLGTVLDCDGSSEAAVRPAHQALQERVAARPTAADLRAAANRVAQVRSLAAALVLYARVAAVRPPAACAHTTGAACARCLATAEEAAAALAAACELMGAATLASLPPTAQQQVFATVTALRDAAYAMARRALDAVHWPHVSAPGNDGDGASDSASEIPAGPSNETFSRIFELCIACQAMYRQWCPSSSSESESATKTSTPEQEQEEDTSGTPMEQSCKDVVQELVVNPVVERFVYHFCGTKATAAMPCLRWALQFVTDTLRRVAPFVREAVQPAVARAAPRVCVLRALGAALVARAARKSVAALNAFAPDADYPTRDALVVHCVNELSTYDAAVRRAPLLRALGLPSLAAAVFAAPDARRPGSTLLDRWVHAEWALASQALDTQLKQKDSNGGASTAGASTNTGMLAPCWNTDPASEYGAPAVAETVVDLAFAVAERAALLPEAAARAAFAAQFQVPLFQRFLHELTAAEPRGARRDALAARCTLARACLYCEDALGEWLEDVLPAAAPDAALVAAAAALADSYALMRRDLVARTVALALDAFCPTVSRLFSSTTLYGVLATSASDEATTAATTASARGTADAQEAPVITDVSEQTAFALEALLPGVQQCVDALRVLRVGGAALAEEFLTAVCTRVAATYVTGLTTRPAARTLAPAAVAQLCADADAVRAALAAFDAPLAARHLAPLADCCTFLRTGQVPPDSPLPPSVRSDLALLHILS